MRRDTRAAESASHRVGRSENRGAPGPHCQEHRRRLLGGICECCGRRPLRWRGSDVAVGETSIDRISFRRRLEMEVKTPRAMTSRSILANHSSTWLSQEVIPAFSATPDRRRGAVNPRGSRPARLIVSSRGGSGQSNRPTSTGSKRPGGALCATPCVDSIEGRPGLSQHGGPQGSPLGLLKCCTSSRASAISILPSAFRSASQNGSHRELALNGFHQQC